MIRYPILKNNAVIGVTAPSSGLPKQLHHFTDEIKNRFNGYHEVVFGATTYTQYKGKSADAVTRAKEFNQFMLDDEIDAVIPPFGGELALEMIDKINFGRLEPKWLIGYSDISLVSLAITLTTGIATAHGTNIVDLRGQYSDSTTQMWHEVLQTPQNDSVVQYASQHFQSVWPDKPTDYIFNFDTPTEWKSINNEPVTIEGRMLGGCIDVIHHLIGTPYGNLSNFRHQYINNEPIIWYFENCDAEPTSLRRMLVQMKLAGWFDHCNGIVFGRTAMSYETYDYSIVDVYEDIADDLNIPIIYDIDCGHLPPQITFVNGSYGTIEYANGKGKVIQAFI